MERTVYDTIVNNNLVSKGDTVLCAVSGGADSVALLHCMYALKDMLGISVKVAHFNHHIRGEAADSDERFVRDMCAELGTEYFSGEGDVPGYAKEHGYTLEQAGRILRYEFLYSIDCDKIAVAHHMDDQAESVLMHIIRGSGTHGITGMRYMRGQIIRPLLGVRRRDIEAYLAERNIPFCTDITNFSENGTRNKLRLRIIPEITESINSAFTESLCHMADIVRADDDYLCDTARAELEKSRIDDGFDRAYIADLPSPIRRRVLFFAMQEKGAYADIEQKHIEAAERLLRAKTGARLHLPHIHLFTSYDKICFSKAHKSATMEEVNSVIPFCEGITEFTKYSICVERIKGNGFTSDSCASYIDADKLPPDAVFRTRCAGDRIDPIGSTGSKKLKDYFIDRKVGRERRDMPVLCAESSVLCIPGMCVSKNLAVTEKTVCMYKISVEENQK